VALRLEPGLAYVPSARQDEISQWCFITIRGSKAIVASCNHFPLLFHPARVLRQKPCLAGAWSPIWLIFVTPESMHCQKEKKEKKRTEAAPAICSSSSQLSSFSSCSHARSRVAALLSQRTLIASRQTLLEHYRCEVPRESFSVVLTQHKNKPMHGDIKFQGKLCMISMHGAPASPEGSWGPCR
jgi:hypothetical protein